MAPVLQCPSAPVLQCPSAPVRQCASAPARQRDVVAYPGIDPARAYDRISYDPLDEFYPDRAIATLKEKKHACSSYR